MVRRHYPLLVVAAAAGLLALPMATAYAVPSTDVALTFTVTTTSDAGDGVCDATCTLRDAVGDAAAVSGKDTIVFAAGLAGSTITLNGTQIVVASNVRIDGGRRNVSISAAGGSRVLDVASGAEVDLIGLRIADGEERDGAGVRNAGLLTVIACVFEGNNALDSFGDGGGIFSTGTLVVSNSVFRDNAGQTGGGIDNELGSLTVSASRFESNGGYEGAGLASSGTATITDSWFTGNESVVDGGGLANGGTMTLSNSTVSDNSAFDLGGGILNGAILATAAVLTVRNSTISGNDSEFYLGGGLYVGNGSSVELINSTVVGNAGDEGGGVYNDGTTSYTNSILAGNAAVFGPDDCSGPVSSEGYNVVVTGGGCGTVATDRTANPATFFSTVVRPIAGNGGLTPTHLLRWSGSNPALDIGGSCPALDQRRLVAPLDSPDPGTSAACDAGSVEAAGVPTARVILTPSDEPALVGQGGGSITYTARITNISGATRSFDVWSRTLRPDGTVTGTQFSGNTGSLASTASRTYEITVSMAGPPGLYRVEFFAGTATTVIGGADAFAVSKAGRG